MKDQKYFFYIAFHFIFIMSFNQSHQQRDDLDVIDLQGALEEEEDQEDYITFHVSSETIKIKFHQFCKYSHIIQEECQNMNGIQDIIERLERDLQRYQIRPDNIKKFFKLLKKDKMQITSDQYLDFCKLSEIFKVKSLKRLLKIYSQKFSQNLNFVINLLIEQQNQELDDLFPDDYVSNDAENILVKNVEDCLNNELFGHLSASTIYRIIEKSGNQIKSDTLFRFIFESIEERFCLLKFLDLKQLSNENLEALKLIYQQNESRKFLDFLPNDFPFLKKLLDDKQILETKLEQLKEIKEQIEQMNTQITSDNSGLKSQVQSLENENQRFKDLNIEISSENDRLKSDNQRLIDKNQQLETQNSQIIIDNTQLKSKNRKLLDENRQVENQNKQFGEENHILKEQQAKMKDENDKLKIHIKEEKESNDHLQSMCNKLTIENNQNKTLKNKFEEENKDFENQINQMKKEKLNDQELIKDGKNFSNMTEKFVLNFQNLKDINKSGISFIFIKQFYIMHVNQGILNLLNIFYLLANSILNQKIF